MKRRQPHDGSHAAAAWQQLSRDLAIATKVAATPGSLSTAARDTLSVLLEHFNRKTSRCDPGYGRLAAIAGCSRRRMMRGVAQLAQLGLICKKRHGGLSQRNSYEFLWPRFREIEVGRQAHFRSGGRPPAVTAVSPEPGQSCHLSGDTGGAQTFLKNPFEEPSAVEPDPSSAAPVFSGRGLPDGSKTGDAGQRSAFADAGKPHSRSLPCVGLKHFQARANSFPARTSSAAAARTQAERRWNNDLIKRYSGDSSGYEAAVEAISPELQLAATEAELCRAGAGITVLLNALMTRTAERTDHLMVPL